MMFPKETGLAHTLQTSVKIDTFLTHWSLIFKREVQALKVVALVIVKSSQRFQAPGPITDSRSPVAGYCHYLPLPATTDHSRKSDFSTPERNLGIRFIPALSLLGIWCMEASPQEWLITNNQHHWTIYVLVHTCHANMWAFLAEVDQKNFQQATIR